MTYIHCRLLLIVSCFTMLSTTAKEQGETITPEHKRSEKATDTLHEKQVPVPVNSRSTIEAPLNFKLGNIEYFQYPVVSNPAHVRQTAGNSGYHALKNLFLSMKLISHTPSEQKTIEAQLQDATIVDTLFAQWRSHIVEFRQQALAVDYLKDSLLLALPDAKRITYKEITSLDFHPLYLERAVVVFNKDGDNEKKRSTELLAIISLIPAVSKSLIKAASPTQTYTITRQQIINAFEKEATNRAKENIRARLVQSREVIESYFPTLDTIHFEIESTKNTNIVRVNGEQFYKRVHGRASDRKSSHTLGDSRQIGHTAEDRPDGLSDDLNGDWLSSSELMELARQEKADTSSFFNKELQTQIPLHCLDFGNGDSLTRQLENDMKLKWLTTELEKAPTIFAAHFLISYANHWISCIITKIEETIYLVVTDSDNLDRHLEPGITKLINVCTESLTQKKMQSSSKDADAKKSNGQGPYLDWLKENADKSAAQKEAVKVNYDAPLAHVSLEELPSTEDLCGGKISNTLQVLINQLKTARTSTRKLGTKLKNCTILYGPPGTGKSTLAQRIAREAKAKDEPEPNILYAGGGDFRDAFQGSGKAKLDALFAEAKRLAQLNNNRSVIIIDEIDGTSSQLEPKHSTQEDNRAIKSLITTLDQYRYDRSIYVICTTNYPEKIDPAILRRFSCVEIALPTYEGRKKILEYYFKINGIEINDEAPNAVSPSFFEALITCTDGLSGDALGELVNNAAHEAEYELTPEMDISTRFRFNSIDFNRSLGSNIAPLIAAPFMPFVHALGQYKNTEFDKHLYAQCHKQLELKDNLEKAKHKKNADELEARREGLPRRWLNIAEHAIVTAIVSTAIAYGSKMVLGYFTKKNEGTAAA